MKDCRPQTSKSKSQKERSSSSFVYHKGTGSTWPCVFSLVLSFLDAEGVIVYGIFITPSKEKGWQFFKRITWNFTCEILDNKLLFFSHSCILKTGLLSRFGNRQRWQGECREALVWNPVSGERVSGEVGRSPDSVWVSHDELHPFAGSTLLMGWTPLWAEIIPPGRNVGMREIKIHSHPSQLLLHPFLKPSLWLQSDEKGSN